MNTDSTTLQTLSSRPLGPPRGERSRVLAVGLDSSTFERVVPFFDRASFEVDRFPGPDGALDLLTQVDFPVVVVRFPLPSLDLGSFLTALRDPASASRDAALILVAESDQIAAAEAFLGQGVNRVVDLAQTADRLQVTLAELVEVAPRRASRFLARMEVRLDGGVDQVLGIVRNTSASGLLIETGRGPDPGTEIDFELTLPNGARPVRGVAEVVRRTRPEREPITGVGVRILSVAGRSGRDFAAYLADAA
ncbi:MAG: PilZ domain-containing protein [Acidobacteriota bacterium]